MTSYNYSIGVAVTATGTGAIAGGTGVAGTGTAFSTEFAAGDYITVAGETRIIASVTNNTALVVTVAFSGTASGQAITRVRLTNVESLTVASGEAMKAPKGDFEPYSQPLNLGNGGVRGGGWPVASWKWGVMTRPQRNALRAYCTGASAAVYIKTTIKDSSDAYAIYSAAMIWPLPEERDATRRVGFEVKFRALVAWP